MADRVSQIGQTYPAALASAGVARVTVTRPPYPCMGVGELRVVAVREQGGETSLVLCYQTYRRLPRPAELPRVKVVESVPTEVAQ